MPKAHGYIRVSTVDQADSGFSLEAQEAKCLEYFERIQKDHPELEWGKMWVDAGKSAWKLTLLQRPAGGEMYGELKDGDHVIFLRMDRAFRSARDFLEVAERWKKHGIMAHAVDHKIDLTTATGRAMASMLAVFAQMESDVRSERVKEALKTKKEKGLAYGQDRGGEVRSPEYQSRQVEGGLQISLDKRFIGAAGMIVHLRMLGTAYEEIADRLNPCLVKRGLRTLSRKDVFTVFNRCVNGKGRFHLEVCEHEKNILPFRNGVRQYRLDGSKREVEIPDEPREAPKRAKMRKRQKWWETQTWSSEQEACAAGEGIHLKNRKMEVEVVEIAGEAGQYGLRTPQNRDPLRGTVVGIWIDKCYSRMSE